MRPKKTEITTYFLQFNVQKCVLCPPNVSNDRFTRESVVRIDVSSIFSSSNTASNASTDTPLTTILVQTAEDMNWGQV